MAVRDLTLPRLGETMDTGRMVRWLKEPGDLVARGETMLELETDKTIVELPSLLGGRLLEQLCQAGDDIAVGAVIGRMEVEGADASAAGAVAPSAAQAAAVPQAAAVSQPSQPAPHASHATHEGARRATPAARAAARAAGVALDGLQGSGRRGRIEVRDVQSAAPGRTAPAGLHYADTALGRIAFADSGAGAEASVLLLHGFSADNSVWAALASSLGAAGLRVIAPDLAGHGSTTAPASTVESLTAPVLALVQALGPRLQGPLHLIGHSLGAVVASQLAEQLGARVASLTLIAPAGLGREIAADFVHGMAAVQTPGELAHLLHFLGERGTGLSDAMLKTLADELARGRLQTLAQALAAPSGAQRVDVLRLLEKLPLRLPVRVYMGLQDRVIPPGHAHRLPARVAVHWLAQSGHMPMWDQPRELLDLLLNGPLQEVSRG